jgi:hypothetical protein
MSARQAIDYGTPERARHDQLVIEGDERSSTTHIRVATQTSLDRYFVRGRLGDDAEENYDLLQVGKRYAEYSYSAGMMGSAKIIDLNRVAGGPGEADHAHICREKVRLADQHVGPTHASVLRAVCVEEWTAEAWAKKRGMAQGHGIGTAFLVDALRVLGKFWGMV